MSAPNKITFVCTGNTCRSPIGEYLLKDAIQNEEQSLHKFEVVSAGVAAYPGDAISLNSAETLSDLGIDASMHRSQPVSEDLINQSILVVCMTSSHQDVVQAYFPEHPHIHLISDFIEDDSITEVSDPFGANIDAYHQTRDQIALAIPSILAFLKKTL